MMRHSRPMLMAAVATAGLMLPGMAAAQHSWTSRFTGAGGAAGGSVVISQSGIGNVASGIAGAGGISASGYIGSGPAVAGWPVSSGPGWNVGHFAPRPYTTQWTGSLINYGLPCPPLSLAPVYRPVNYVFTPVVHPGLVNPRPLHTAIGGNVVIGGFGGGGNGIGAVGDNGVATNNNPITTTNNVNYTVTNNSTRSNVVTNNIVNNINNSRTTSFVNNNYYNNSYNTGSQNSNTNGGIGVGVGTGGTGPGVAESSGANWTPPPVFWNIPVVWQAGPAAPQSDGGGDGGDGGAGGGGAV